MKKLIVPFRAYVLDQERRTAKNGKDFWQVNIKTILGIIKCMIWDIKPDAETNPEYPHTGDIILVTCIKDQLAEHQNIVIHNFNRIAKEDIPPGEEIILGIERAPEAVLKAAWDNIHDSSFWVDIKNHEFTMRCLELLDQDKLRGSPAAARVHHTFQGGLIVHTSEVLDLCRVYVQTTKQYPYISPDVLYAAAILHDIGKVETYSFNELGVPRQEKTDRIIGHMFYAMHIVKNAAERWGDLISPDFVTEVLHCIAAHHGTRDWGSIVEPFSLEAGILSRIDYLSSRNGMMDKVMKDNLQSGQPLQEEFKIYSHDYFASMAIRSFLANGS